MPPSAVPLSLQSSLVRAVASAYSFGGVRLSSGRNTTTSPPGSSNLAVSLPARSARPAACTMESKRSQCPQHQGKVEIDSSFHQLRRDDVARQLRLQPAGDRLDHP